MVSHDSLLADREAFFRYKFHNAVRQAQVVSRWNSNPLIKRGWRLFGNYVQQNTWIYHIFLFGLTFTFWASFYFPVLWTYQANNKHRTYDAAIQKERAYKKKLRDSEK